MDAYRESRDKTTLVLAVAAAGVAQPLAPGSMVPGMMVGRQAQVSLQAR